MLTNSPWKSPRISVRRADWCEKEEGSVSMHIIALRSSVVVHCIERGRGWEGELRGEGRKSGRSGVKLWKFVRGIVWAVNDPPIVRAKKDSIRCVRAMFELSGK
jgi:hypothetical protein